jgi:acetyl-CoA decarbonylase/synthase complex subunit delta
VPPVTPAAPAPPKVVELLSIPFKYPQLPYTSKIAEVQLGATKSEGGSRGVTYKLGGYSTPPMFLFQETSINRPLFALDVFDMRPTLAGPVKRSYADVLEDPVAWAKKCIETYKADLVSVHLVSTDPGIKDTPPSEARRTVEDVLQAIDEPIIVGGSGNPEKDIDIFREIAKATEGEKLVFASITLDMDIPKAVEPLVKHGQNAIALAFMDINQAKELSRKILEAGLPKNQLILDPTTGALGYGIEYSFSVMERIRLAALMGEEILQVPMSCAATNAWAAREAWMKVEEWGPRELRGPLWEATTAIVCMLAGADLFMMMHPLAMKIAKTFAEALQKVRKPLSEIPYEKWVEAKY